MLSGVKFISRDRLHGGGETRGSDLQLENQRRSKSRKDKHKKSKWRKSSHVGDSDSEDKPEKTQKKRKKWYSSKEDSSDSSLDSYSESESISDIEKTSYKSSRESQKIEKGNSSSDKAYDGVGRRFGKEKRKKKDEGSNDVAFEEIHVISRNEMGLDWMNKPVNKQDDNASVSDIAQVSKPVEVEKQSISRELNPYLRDNGTGYPDEASQGEQNKHHLHSSSLVGDGGASWRLKALKRAREQAEREGRKFDEVVEERWGSLGHLALSVTSHKAAPAKAHLHAIYDRKRGQTEAQENSVGKMMGEKCANEEHAKREDCLQDISSRNRQMRKPKNESFSWRKGRDRGSENTSVISAALSNINKFSNDGSFMEKFVCSKKNVASDTSYDSEGDDKYTVAESSKTNAENSEVPAPSSGLSSNQLAAKALQLRLKGKHEEAEKILKDVEAMKVTQDTGVNSDISDTRRDNSRLIRIDRSNQLKKDDDGDLHLAQTIMRNKQYSMSKSADDEYDFDDDAPVKKRNRISGATDRKAIIRNHLQTQKERCQFCIDNPTRPKHLIVSIAQFAYMMLPQSQPVVQGHCCILPIEHESSTRSVDDNVWEEIRNFKKCLLMMFAKEEKGVIFLETVIGLARQQRHCLVECIPMPQGLAKQAPLYFKKAIDEAEDEWSQHNAKKLIHTTREKGLRRSVPKDFPYFHVEFGLDEGFVHVIDDETKFASGMGLNVIRGMLKLPEEDMHRRRRHEPVEKQRLAVATFARSWEPFDWTKQLG